MYKLLLCFINLHYQIIKSPVLIQKQPIVVFCQGGVLGDFAGFMGEHLCCSLHFNRVASLSHVTLLIRRLWHGCFPVGFDKFLRVPFLQCTSGRLLLSIPLSYPFLTLLYFSLYFLTQNMTTLNVTTLLFFFIFLNFF